jgi:hypothetical protein
MRLTGYTGVYLYLLVCAVAIVDPENPENIFLLAYICWLAKYSICRCVFVFVDVTVAIVDPENPREEFVAFSYFVIDLLQLLIMHCYSATSFKAPPSVCLQRLCGLLRKLARHLTHTFQSDDSANTKPYMVYCWCNSPDTVAAPENNDMAISGQPLQIVPRSQLYGQTWPNTFVITTRTILIGPVFREICRGLSEKRNFHFGTTKPLWENHGVVRSGCLCKRPESAVSSQSGQNWPHTEGAFLKRTCCALADWKGTVGTMVALFGCTVQMLM